jgi:hypothetical protein
MKNLHSFQPSQGADGESEFDDEEVELISDAEEVPVHACRGYSRLSVLNLHSTDATN